MITFADLTPSQLVKSCDSSKRYMTLSYPSSLISFLNVTLKSLDYKLHGKYKLLEWEN